MWMLQRGARSKTEKEENVALAIGKSWGCEEWLVDRSCVTLDKKIGAGGFGTVYVCLLAVEEPTSSAESSSTEGTQASTPSGAPPSPATIRAVAKQINVSKLSEKDLPLLKSEVANWASISHPHCVRFLGVCCSPSEHLLLSQYMANGSLDVLLKTYLRDQRPPLTQHELCSWMLPVADGMRYLHSKRLIHRDLKSPNILLGGSGQLAISDFGLSRYFQAAKTEFTAETGSYRWMAPEVTRHEPYDEKCDVYSYGCLAYEMTSYCVPFQHMSTLEAAFAVASKAARPAIPASCPAQIANLIQECWRQASEARPPFELVYRRLLEVQGTGSRLLEVQGTGSRMLDMASAAPGGTKREAAAGGSIDLD